MSIPDKYKVDRLFLLVGENPLPNYVAARTLLNDGGTVYLVFTNQTITQQEILGDCFEDLQLDNTKIDLGENESNAFQIRDRIQKEMKTLKGGTVGLNYTGGTKAMAVHAYRTIKELKPNAVFSYLDSRTLKMRIDDEKEEPIDCEVKLDPPLKLETLFMLHDNLWRKEEPPQSKPKLSDTEIEEKLKAVRNGENFEDGKWLESYVLREIQKKQGDFGIEESMISFHIRARDKNQDDDRFEFDVAFIKGYQLFAISCTTGSRKGKCKQKLFEAHLRARQLGGDEARVALVCCYDDSPDDIKDEVRFAVPDKKIEVFGRKDLANLADKIANWIDLNNQEANA